MRTPRTLTTVVTVVLTAVISTLTTLAVAGPPPPVTGTGTDINRVKTISHDPLFMTSSTSPVDVPDASRRINVSGSALIVARFQADAFCFGSDPGKCFVRIAVDDGVTETEVFPGVSVFLNAPSNFATEQTRSIERSVTVGPGDYTVKVQAFVEDPDDAIGLQRYHLTVERIV